MAKTDTMQRWLVRVLKGMVIALGFILPGVSGGVLAAILGIYERMLNFMAHVRTRWRQDFLYFLPVGIGGLLGLALLSAPLEYLLNHYQLLVLWSFAGAMVGTLPSLYQTAGQQGRKMSDGIWMFAAALIGGLGLFHLAALTGPMPINGWSWLLAGSLLALGVILPGLSPSNLLLYLGLFGPMLTGFKSLNWTVLLPIAVGGLVTLLLMSKVMVKILEQAYSVVYHIIIGIVGASIILILIPPVANYNHTSVLEMVLCLLLFILGIGLGWKMSQLEKRYK